MVDLQETQVKRTTSEEAKLRKLGLKKRRRSSSEEEEMEDSYSTHLSEEDRGESANSTHSSDESRAESSNSIRLSEEYRGESSNRTHLSDEGTWVAKRGRKVSNPKVRRISLSSESSSDEDSSILKLELKTLRVKHKKLLHKLKLKNTENTQLRERIDQLQELVISLQTQQISLISANASAAQNVSPTHEGPEVVADLVGSVVNNPSMGPIENREVSSATSPCIINVGRASTSRNAPVTVVSTPNKASLDTSQQMPMPTYHCIPMSSGQYMLMPENANNTSFQEQVLRALAKMTYQLENLQNQIKRVEEMGTGSNRRPVLPKGVDLPIASMKVFNNFLLALEDHAFFVSLASYLSHKIGHSNVVERLLKFLLNDGFSTQLNWAGRNGKRAIKNTKLVDFVKYAIERNLKTTDEVVEAKIKTWLKHSTDRLKRDATRNQSNIYCIKRSINNNNSLY
ncbi:uncharacterized protein LOC129232442 [Uloborus diversus]|uniref:uncharacterized protein LOC129232442 n=1 Tax=Uloborus diversus TaxID=327109 RepID=UPI00240A784A|nr:uncharacterized protein LOC129232442 [Uloborus diversus]